MTAALKQVGRSVSRAVENLAEGWRELVDRSTSALTRFIPGAHRGDGEARRPLATFPAWGLLAGEIMETDKSIVVQIEMPGIDKRDCEVTIEGAQLRVRGTKHASREHHASSYYLAERAYGSFERTIRLPANVDTAAAKASWRDGVLTVELRKTRGGRLVVK